MSGLLSAVFLPRGFWIAPVGVYVGQLLYGLFLYHPEGASLWPFGMVLAIFYSVATLGGALTGALGMWLLGMLVGMLQFLFGRRGERK